MARTAMAPKGEKKLGASSKAPGKATKDVPAKAAPAKKQKALMDAPDEEKLAKVAKLVKTDVRDYLGHLNYHAGKNKAKQPRDIDPTAAELLASYHDATPEQQP